MTRSRLPLPFGAIALTLALAGSVAAQSAPTLSLGKPAARSKYTLGRLFSMQELPDARVIASDVKEQAFRIVDLKSGEVGIVGSQGDDAGSYRAASNVLRLAGDSLGLYDPAGRRMLHVTPQGTVAALVALPTMSNTRRIGTLIGADQNGALYFTLPEQFDTATKALTGIAGVTRFSPRADADEPQLTFRTRRADQTKPAGMLPFVYRDAVAIRSDGLMARVVADTYEVVWARNGREIGRTGPLPFTPVMLTAEEQQAVKDSIVDGVMAMMAAGGRGGPGGSGGTSFSSDGAAPAMASGGGGGGGQRIVIVGGSAGGGAPIFIGGSGGATFATRMDGGDAKGAGGDTKVVTNAPFDPADITFGEFPAYKPPMPSGNNVAMFDGNGNLWVERTSTHGDAVTHYDVITEGKGLIARMILPIGTRLLGFGRNAVYLARPDEGSDWLERYAMPKM